MRKINATAGPWIQHHLYPTALVSRADPTLSLLTVDEDGTALFLSEEDCRLAAAAPDLLEALRRCKFDSLNMSLEDLEFCRAAYAKAAGEAA